MKTIIKLLTVLSALLIGTMASGQDDVTLTVFGEGATKDEATANALRSAIEQAYGVFVSADTKILNDQLVKDEIVTISTGNIRSYKELSQVQTSNGMYNVSLSAVVSVQNLIKYSQSHGSSAEFAGQTFTYNMRMRELNKKNEMAALNNMVEQLRSMQNDIFDYIIEVKEPKLISGNNYSVPVSVAVTTNPNYENFIQVISNTLGSLSLTLDEIKSYYLNNMSVQLFTPYYSWLGGLSHIDDKESKYVNHSGLMYELGLYYLRSDYGFLKDIAERICSIINNAQLSFNIRIKGSSAKSKVPFFSDNSLKVENLNNSLGVKGKMGLPSQPKGSLRVENLNDSFGGEYRDKSSKFQKHILFQYGQSEWIPTDSEVNRFYTDRATTSIVLINESEFFMLLYPKVINT